MQLKTVGGRVRCDLTELKSRATTASASAAALAAASASATAAMASAAAAAAASRPSELSSRAATASA